ncbi:MAG: T9SS type A sorting domain-containing protein, partial [Bacteroidales bacterium]|nr:T9SS type A sorting domain-containing protein [Bacteroidales bacterium]
FMLDDVVITSEIPGILAPYNLDAQVDDETGEVALTWDFDGQGTGGWLTLSGDWTENGGDYEVSGNTHKWSSLYYDEEKSSYTFSATVKKNSGTDSKSVGLFLNGDPQLWFSNGFWKSGYLFSVGNEDGWNRYSFSNQVDNEFVYIIPWMEYPAMNAGWCEENKLQVKYENETFELRINDSIVASISGDTTFKTGYCGLAMYDEQTNGNASFSNITLESAKDDPVFQYFNVFRNNVLLGTTQTKNYSDLLTEINLYTYYITAQYDLGESQPSNYVEVPWQLSVNEKSITPVRFYPNPVSDFLHISSEIDITSISITDKCGRTVFADYFDGKLVDLDVSDLSNGMYFARINSGNGYQSIKFVVIKP